MEGILLSEMKYESYICIVDTLNLAMWHTTTNIYLNSKLKRLGWIYMNRSKLLTSWIQAAYLFVYHKQELSLWIIRREDYLLSFGLDMLHYACSPGK